jgi:hypothetical protein
MLIAGFGLVVWFRTFREYPLLSTFVGYWRFERSGFMFLSSPCVV